MKSDWQPWYEGFDRPNDVLPRNKNSIAAVRDVMRATWHVYVDRPDLFIVRSHTTGRLTAFIHQSLLERN